MKKLFDPYTDGSCALRALKYLSKSSEYDVLAAFVSQGMTEWVISNVAKSLNVRLLELNCGGVTVAEFIKRYPKGSYLITTVNHAFVIENGVQIDRLATPGTRRIINRAWKVLK